MRKTLKVLLVFFLMFIPTSLISHIGFIDKTYVSIIINQLLTTVEIVIPVILTTVAVGFSLSWIFALYEFPFKKILEKILILGMIFPSYVLAIFYSEMFGFTGKLALIGTLVISSLPYVFMLTSIGFKSQSQQFVDAALMFGKNSRWIKMKVLLPLLTPSLILSSFIVFGDSFSEFGATYFFGVDTVMTGIYEIWFSLHESKQGIKFSAWIFLGIIVSYFFISWWKSSVKKLNSVAGKNIEPLKTEKLEKNGWLVSTVIFLITTITFFLPLSLLFEWLFVVYLKADWIRVLKVTFNSISLSTLIATIVLFISTLLLYLFKKYSFILSTICNTLYSTPGVILAISMVYVSSTKFLIPFVFLFVLTIKYIGIGVDGISLGLNKIPRQLYYDVKSFGKDSIWYIKNVQIPLSFKSYLMAGLLIWIDVMRELPIGLTSRPQWLDLVSIEIFRCMDLEMLSTSSPYILSMIVSTLIPIYFVNLVVKMK